MDRVCGATVERDALSQSRCWCGGLFCGRGGARATRKFRKDFHVTGHAASRADAESLMAQLDLYNGDELRERWLTAMDAHTSRRRKRVA